MLPPIFPFVGKATIFSSRTCGNFQTDISYKKPPYPHFNRSNLLQSMIYHFLNRDVV